MRYMPRKGAMTTDIAGSSQLLGGFLLALRMYDCDLAGEEACEVAIQARGATTGIVTGLALSVSSSECT